MQTWSKGEKKRIACSDRPWTGSFWEFSPEQNGVISFRNTITGLNAYWEKEKKRSLRFIVNMQTEARGIQIRRNNVQKIRPDCQTCYYWYIFTRRVWRYFTSYQDNYKIL